MNKFCMVLEFNFISLICYDQVPAGFNYPALAQNLT
jgi:hypothetical protein